MVYNDCNGYDLAITFWWLYQLMDRQVVEVSSLSLLTYLSIYLSNSLSLSVSLFLCLSVCLSIYLSIYLSISSVYLIMYLSTSSFTYLTMYLSIYLPIYLSIYLPVSLSVSIYLSIHLSIYLCLSNYLPIYLSLSFSLSVCLSICKLENEAILCATTACAFSTSQLPKVVREWCALYILTSTWASRHNCVYSFDIATSKSGPNVRCFQLFHLQMCFAPQRRALVHLSSGQMAPHPPL